MDTYISPEVRAGLEKARKRASVKGQRLCVHVGDRVIKIVQAWDCGFALRQSDSTPLRGRVNIYDGPRHLSEGLIMFSAHEDDLICYEYKRIADVQTDAPLDYERDQDRPIALMKHL